MLFIFKIETASIAQQAYQLVLSWLTECQRMLQNVCSDQYSQHIKDLGSFTASLYHRAYDNIHFGYYSARINFRDFYRQLGGLQSSDGNFFSIILIFLYFYLSC